MSTTALNSVNNKSNIFDRQKTPKQIIKEEIQRKKKLEEIEKKYKAGEISEFEYKASKFLLSITPKDKDMMSKNINPVFSTTA